MVVLQDWFHLSSPFLFVNFAIQLKPKRAAQWFVPKPKYVYDAFWGFIWLNQNLISAMLISTRLIAIFFSRPSPLNITSFQAFWAACMQSEQLREWLCNCPIIQLSIIKIINYIRFGSLDVYPIIILLSGILYVHGWEFGEDLYDLGLLRWWCGWDSTHFGGLHAIWAWWCGLGY